LIAAEITARTVIRLLAVISEEGREVARARVCPSAYWTDPMIGVQFLYAELTLCGERGNCSHHP